MLAYLLILAPGRAQADIDGFAEFMKSAKTLSVDVRVKRSTVPGEGVGKFIIERPSRLRLAMTWAGSDYVFVQNERGMLEIEHSARAYRELPFFERYTFLDSRISDVPMNGFPAVLLMSSLKELLPPGAKFSSAKSEEETPPGATSFVVTLANGPLAMEVRVELDGQGRLLRLVTKEGPPGQSETIAYRFSNYVVDKPLPQDMFFPIVPQGYFADTLPPDAYPVGFGQKVSLGGFAALKSTTPTDLRLKYGAKPLFVLLADPDCSPSLEAIRAMREAAQALRAEGAELAIAWTEPHRAASAASFADEYYDPTGKALERFQAPGTPFIMLVEERGLVFRAWFGFDPAHAANLRSDLLKSVQDLNAMRR